jgi:hypothetical protein
MRRQALFLYVFLGIALSFFGYWIFWGAFKSNPTDSQLQKKSQDLITKTNSVFQSIPESQPINWTNLPKSSLVSNSSNNSWATFNITNSIATDFSSEFVAKYSSGSEIPTSSVNQWIDKSLAKYSTTTLEFDKPVDEKKLKIIEDNSITAKQNYFNEVGKLFLANLEFISESTMKEAASNVFEKDDYSLAQKIAEANYQVVDKLVLVSVPSSLTELHKKILQSFDNIAYFFSLMINYKNDPVKFMMASNYFPKIIEEGKSISSQLDKFISLLKK